MAITNARMQIKRGEEINFDPDKVLIGEFTLSIDEKIIRIGVAPGVSIRLATYDAFEEDMAQVIAILEEAKTVQEAIEKIYEEFKNAELDIETAKTAAQTATEKAEEASVSAQNAYDDSVIAENKALEASESAEIASAKAVEATEASENAILKANESSESANEASNSAENAKLSEDKSIENATLSESYAVGGTGTRTGENEDNSKYYSEVAKTESDKATTEADRAKAEADRAQGLVGGDFVTNSQIKEYSLIKDTGYELGLSIDNSTYVMTVQLKNANGSVLSEKSIDFPIESMVINATYSNGVITLTLQNGTTLPVDVSALVSGLVKNTFTIAGIDMKDNITATELKTALGLNNVANVTVNNQAPTFTQASTRANIASGEKLSVLFGKIMKWFADLKTVAFSGSYSDLSNRPSPLDTYEEITANTESGKFAGALGVQEGFEQLTNSLKLVKATSVKNATNKTITTTAQYLLSEATGQSGDTSFLQSLPTGIYVAKTGYYDISIKTVVNLTEEDVVNIGYRNFIDTSNFTDSETRVYAKGYHHVIYHDIGAYISAGTFIRPIISGIKGIGTTGSCVLTVIKR